MFPLRLPWATASRASRSVPEELALTEDLQPVVVAGVVNEDGRVIQTHETVAADAEFLFEDRNQAIGPGASLFSNQVLEMDFHDGLIIALLDSSTNNINVDIIYRNPDSFNGAWSPFEPEGSSVGSTWSTNKISTNGELADILLDTGEVLAVTWRFFKINSLRGTRGTLEIRSNEGVNPGTLSMATRRIS